MKPSTRYTTLAAAILASTLVVACGEREDATVGERMDGAVNEAQQAGSQMREDARQAGQDMQAAGSEAADTIARDAADAAITAKVNAALAADTQLSALAIDVDTSNGQVELKGTAPTAAAKDRATTLAAAVEGVVKVDNRLTVEATS
ncbi:BON domain-containing protein [uncultured Hydrogenophaga sp.]|jgi:hyperosmotically inducible protein|uniref:BON domain-containing protein n=1 Tax=uncultured Hydrogenophaga sp. TaxID=199683 RepID=UPI00258BD601|nr:BON domain-containing protein [uncultured Hydrogenophaga sp.]